MLYWRTFIFIGFVLYCAHAAQADLKAMDADFNSQLAANDVEAAHSIGLEYYATAEDEDDHSAAGRVAYTMASIASLRE
nr:hypothetical protein [Alphaproteobacteria bacterium]